MVGLLVVVKTELNWFSYEAKLGPVWFRFSENPCDMAG